MRLRFAAAFFLASAFSTAGYAAIGRIQSTNGVSPNGGAQYSIPIKVPPGIRGLQPTLALAYDSQQGYGLLGAGWTLTGLSSIYRCNPTYAQDGTPGSVTLTYSDVFCMDGARLRLTSSETLSTYGQAGTTYQTEIANFSIVTANATAGNGPSYFTVRARNGLTYEYGNTANSKILPCSSGCTTPYEWALDKITDRAGNTISFTYTVTNGAYTISTIAYGNNSIVFAYTTLASNDPNISTTYVAGSAVQQTQQLSTITIKSLTTALHEYTLGYTTSSSTGRATLTTITECGNPATSGGSASDCLPATQVGYQFGTAGIPTSATSAGSEATNGTIYTADLNGDGRKDLVYAVTDPTSHKFVWWIQLAKSTGGYATPFNTGIQTADASDFLVDDFKGIGSAQILAPAANIWTLYTVNSAGTGMNAGVATSSSPNYVAGDLMQYASADADGDGLPDVVGVQEDVTASDINYNVWINTGSGGNVTFPVSPVTHSVPVGPTIYSGPTIYGNNEVPNSPIQHLDFDGDGRQDVIVLFGTMVAGQPQYRAQPFLSRGTQMPVVQTGVVSEQAPSFFAVNWNDDACTDLISYWGVLISQCNGSLSSTLTFPNWVSVALDWDGDGRTDAIAYDDSTGSWDVYRSTGTSYTTVTATVPTASSYLVTDQNGDGLDDLIAVGSSGTLSYALHNGPGIKPDLATSFQDGLGNKVSPTYTTLVQGNYTQYSDATGGYRNYIGPLSVVNEVTFSDPTSTTGATYNQTYWYYGAWTNVQGRGFQAFDAKRMIDSRNGLFYFDYYERGFPYTGMEWSQVLSNDDGAHIRQSQGTTAYTALDSTTYNQRYFPYFSSVVATADELGGTEDGDLITTSSTSYTYDNYGNATLVASTVTDNDPGSPYEGKAWTTTVTNTPDVDTTNWCLNLLTETQVAYTVSTGLGNPATRTKTFTPDTTKCRYIQMVTEPTANGGLYKVTETPGYDTTFGNILTDTVLGAHMPSSPASRETQLIWSASGQFPASVEDPSGATTTYSYTSNQALMFGVPDSSNDPNGLTTSWTYDSMGRKIKETRPDGTSTGWAITACGTGCTFGPSVYQVAKTAYQTNGTTAIRTDVAWYDPIDRVIESYGPTITGSNQIMQRAYDSLGRLSWQSIPFLSSATVYQQTYQYDPLNRVTSVSRPISSTNSTLQTISFAYAGRTTSTTDANGNLSTQLSDVNGWLRSSTDAVGTGYKITRAYDAAGTLAEVWDSSGNTLLTSVQIVYGIKPFITGRTDADLGTWSYTIDSLGEKTAWTDAKGQSFSMTYDALSRPLTRTEPDLFTQWTWGSTPASHNVGQLITECTGASTACGSAYTESRAFDAYGRPSTRSITLSGIAGNDPGGAFLYTNAYDSTTGLLSSLTYPISTSSQALKLQYGYSNGLLKTVTDALDTTATCGTTCVLWTANATNAFGEATQETLGNNVVINRSYDAVTSWLTRATAGIGGGSTLLNQSYLQDKNGNVTQRQNNNLGLTESFAYDHDNRLTCTALASTCTATTLAYDGGSAGPGNITTQTGVGTYTYPAAGQPRPHAVTSITGTVLGVTNPTFSYDANGNMTSRAGSTIAWSSYNYPTDIPAPDGEEVQFQYGPDRQRWKQTYSSSSPTEYTYYVGGPMEVVVAGGATTYRHYIQAGNEQVALYSRSGSTNTMSYVLSDHQGSVSAIASNAGAANVSDSFSAFGQLRNSTTWSGAPTTSELNSLSANTRQGYTFQTMLGQSMGLNHMNGRVEDAILGRFLSPDPHITDRTNPQSYNRYTYVNNNPVTSADQTGFSTQQHYRLCPDACYSGNGAISFSYDKDGGGPPTGGDTSFSNDSGPAFDPYLDGGGLTFSDSSTYSDGTPVLGASSGGHSTSQTDTGSSGELDEVTVTSTRSSSATVLAQVTDPLLAQVIDPLPELQPADPVMQALRSGRLPTAAEEKARMARLKGEVGVPPPLAPVIPPPPFWLQLLTEIGDLLGKFMGVSPSAPPVAPMSPGPQAPSPPTPSVPPPPNAPSSPSPPTAPMVCDHWGVCEA